MSKRQELNIRVFQKLGIVKSNNRDKMNLLNEYNKEKNKLEAQNNPYRIEFINSKQVAFIWQGIKKVAIIGGLLILMLLSYSLE